jgi:hypothetical protein
MIATSIATPSAIRAAHCAAIFTPPSSTNRASTGRAAKIELSASESDTRIEVLRVHRASPLVAGPEFAVGFASFAERRNR